MVRQSLLPEFPDRSSSIRLLPDRPATPLDAVYVN